MTTQEGAKKLIDRQYLLQFRSDLSFSLKLSFAGAFIHNINANNSSPTWGRHNKNHSESYDSSLNWTQLEDEDGRLAGEDECLWWMIQMLIEANQMEEGAPRIQKISLVLKPGPALREKTNLVWEKKLEKAPSWYLNKARHLWSMDWGLFVSQGGHWGGWVVEGGGHQLFGWAKEN